jgi:parallel beta-helix repeat protein
MNFLKCALLVAVLFFSSASFISIFDLESQVQGAGTGDYPPPSQGDWIITQDTIITNEDITVQGNITVSENATLTLDHVTLTINASGYGNALIRVKNGTGLNIINNSMLREGQSQVNYDFVFEKGSHGTIAESTIKNCGWNDGGTFQSTGGILIMSDNVTIADSTITKNYIGIVVFYSSPVIRNNNISDNLKQGIYSWSGSPEITGNDISITPVGLIGLESELILINNNIRDCGDATSFYYSDVTIIGGSISSNSRDDCSTGACSASESGKGIYIEGSKLFMDGVTVSGNDDYGISATTTELDIVNSTFSDNSGSGIVAVYSYGNLSDNEISGNSEYGVSMISDTVTVKDSNSFTDNNELGRVRMAWELSVFVSDSYGNKVSHATLDIQGDGNEITTNTTYSGLAYEIIPEYLIDNDDIRIEYNPYTITAIKIAVWNGVEYSNSTVVQIKEDTDLDIIIPMVSPDLTVEGIDFPGDVTVGKDNKITVTIQNIGDATANDVEITVYETDPENGKSIVNRTTISVAAHDSTELSVSWKPELVGESTIEVSITTGYDELDNENNKMESTVNVKEKEPGLFESIYLYGFVVAFLMVLVGTAIYSLVINKNIKQKEEP